MVEQKKERNLKDNNGDYLHQLYTQLYTMTPLKSVFSKKKIVAMRKMLTI